MRLVRRPMAHQQDDISTRVRELGDFFQLLRAAPQGGSGAAPGVQGIQAATLLLVGSLCSGRACSPSSPRTTPDNGWGGLAAGGLDVRVVPGNHLAMLQKPHVRILAEELRDCLHKAQLEVGSQPESEKFVNDERSSYSRTSRGLAIRV